MKSNKRRGSYGFDAPFLWPVFLVLIVLSLIGGVLSNDPWSFVGTAAVIACISLAFYAATKGKFVVWEKLLNNFGFKGDEQVLDIGCGRGAVLLLAAKHLTTGKAVGIDLWKREDQSGNSINATAHNAMVEGVFNRVELKTGDMTTMPFLMRVLILSFQIWQSITSRVINETRQLTKPYVYFAQAVD